MKHRLYFDKSHLIKIVNAVKAGNGHHVPYTGPDWGVEEDTTQGLQLVGDRGVYLMGNHKHESAPSEMGLVAYATGCHPDKDEFWYENKRMSFGGDDGANFIPLTDADRWLSCGNYPYVEITPKSLSLKSLKRPPTTSTLML